MEGFILVVQLSIIRFSRGGPFDFQGGGGNLIFKEAL